MVPDSSAVELSTVNRVAVGSNPTQGAIFHPHRRNIGFCPLPSQPRRKSGPPGRFASRFAGAQERQQAITPNAIALAAGVQAVVHAMAVLDYEPVKKVNAKVKSDKKYWNVRFKRTPKVIDIVKKTAPGALLIGFKLEYKAGKNGLKRSAAKLFNNNKADYVVANDYAFIKKGVHKAQIFGRDGSVINVTGKELIAKAISGLIS